jgi:16S rRNA (cytosine967-C5)-methyltransferase
MQEAGRLSAAIEILDAIETGWNTGSSKPMDMTLHHYFRERRYIGSSDRGAISERVYFIIRHYGSLYWHGMLHKEQGGRALVIAMLMLIDRCAYEDLSAWFGGGKFAPASLGVAERRYAKALAGQEWTPLPMSDAARHNFPEWLGAELKSSLGSDWREELRALMQEASVDLRANTLLADRETLQKALAEEGVKTEKTRYSPLGLRLPRRQPVFATNAFKKGWFEMQDEGSQIAGLLMQAKPGEKIIDFCAGAGGKTLLMGASMQNKGRILAFDNSEIRLKQMAERLKRAKLDNVQRHVIKHENDAFIKRHKETADGVLVDAPCSGSGTWRRNPDLKWRLTPDSIEALVALQASILESAARLVKKGGRLLYVTCSLLERENEAQIQHLIKNRPNFRVVLTPDLWDNSPLPTGKQGDGYRLSPHRTGTDGFFAALLQRCE